MWRGNDSTRGEGHHGCLGATDASWSKKVTDNARGTAESYTAPKLRQLSDVEDVERVKPRKKRDVGTVRVWSGDPEVFSDIYLLRLVRLSGPEPTSSSSR